MASYVYRIHSFTHVMPEPKILSYALDTLGIPSAWDVGSTDPADVTASAWHAEQAQVRAHPTRGVQLSRISQMACRGGLGSPATGKTESQQVL